MTKRELMTFLNFPFNTKRFPVKSTHSHLTTIVPQESEHSRIDLLVCVDLLGDQVWILLLASVNRLSTIVRVPRIYGTSNFVVEISFDLIESINYTFSCMIAYFLVVIIFVWQT